MRSVSLFFAVAACLVVVFPAAAQDCGGCDAGCGVKAGCKTCELVCGTAPCEVVCFSCVCESFCLPLPACNLFSLFSKKRCGSACGEGCDTGGEPGCVVACDDDCAACCGKPPVCGKVRTRKKLFMRVVRAEVPAYECVVGGGCGDVCGDDAVPAEPAPGPVAPAPAPVAPAPAPEARVYDVPPTPLR